MLWMGAVSNTQYLSDSGIVEWQNEFAESNLLDQKYVPFINVTEDKGYWCSTAAWRCEKQFLLMPTFAKSDQIFTSEHILTSVVIQLIAVGTRGQFIFVKHLACSNVVCTRMEGQICLMMCA